MSRTQRIFDDIDMSPMPMEMGRNYLKNPFIKKNNLIDEVDKVGKQYVGASCCPDAASYPCAVCCTLNPLQCLATCCCPT